MAKAFARRADMFNPTIFYALAGVPNPLELETEEGKVDIDQDEHEHSEDSFVPIPQVCKLTVEEDELYRPIYERRVDLKKVENQLGNPSAGPSKAQLQRKSKTAIERIAHQLSCEAHRLDFAYYLVATSTITPNKLAELGWLEEYTTHPQVATWANKTCCLATVFATYSQGESMAKAITLATANRKAKRQRSDKQQPSDKIKVDLGRLLAALTYKTLGYLPTQSFPQTADPVAELKKRSLPISIVLTEGSRLTDEKLKVGFKKMRSVTRLEWLNDISDGHFCLIKLKVGFGETIGDVVGLDRKDIEAALTTAPREIGKMVEDNDDNSVDASQAARKGQSQNGGNECESENSEGSDDDV
ncbi:hypothetical protein DFH28DRAFT_1137911 [Melampsora americana]|nr:hypothetical protein DFH28DRAFT_1137911 [Melampsora americana]